MAEHYRSHGRFYEAEYPEEGDIVIVRVNRIDDKAGAYVSLKEYNFKEGMINLAEISKRRIRSMAKLLRIGSDEICMVVSVDQEKGYINLSKKRVANEDFAPAQEKYAKAKAIHSIMEHVSTVNEVDVEELCKKVSWPLHVKYTNAFDAFKKHVDGEINLWSELDFKEPGVDLSDKEEKLKKDIEASVQRKLIQSVVKLQAKCEVSCSDYEGIDAVKAALMEGFKASKEECEVSIKLIAHPMFVLNCQCRDKELGVTTLENAMEYIKEAIQAKNGTFLEKAKPTFVQKEPEPPSDSDEDGSSSSDEEAQDETMGDLNEADLADLMKKDLDKGGDDDKDDD